MLPLIAREAARPSYSYDSFYKSYIPAEDDNNSEGRLSVRGGEGTGTLRGSYQEIPSPLVFSPPQFVKFYFQIGCEQKPRSPQIPMGAARLLAEHRFGVSAQSIRLSEQLLSEAENLFTYDLLAAEFSDEAIAAVSSNVASTEKGEDSYPQNLIEKSYYKVPAFENIGAMQSKLSGLLKDKSTGTGVPQLAQSSKQAVQQSRGASRSNEEFNRRLLNTQNLTSQRWQEDNSSSVYETNSLSQIEKVSGCENRDVDSQGLAGVMQPVWVGGNLILMREVAGGQDMRERKMR